MYESNHGSNTICHQIGHCAILTLVILCGVLVSGCEKNPGIIWESSVKSPNGMWVAEAKTEQFGGPGNAYVDTNVALRWTPNSRRPPIVVMDFSDESAYPADAANVKMQWVTNSHLDVTYAEGLKVNFQAIKAAGLDITAHPSTSGAPATK